MHNHRRLKVWRQSYDLALAIYRATRAWPGQERFTLTAQVRRAAISIPSNIAEGSSQESSKAFGRYLRIALGSLAELDTQIRMARDLGYLASGVAARILTDIADVRRMLVGLIRRQDSSNQDEANT